MDQHHSAAEPVYGRPIITAVLTLQVLRQAANSQAVEEEAHTRAAVAAIAPAADVALAVL